MFMVLHNFRRDKKYSLKNFDKVGNSIDDQWSREEWLIIYVLEYAKRIIISMNCKGKHA